MKRVRSCTLVLFLLLAASPAFVFAKGTPVPAKAEPSAFYTLGLSGDSAESAEAILLRAHEGDTQAMALVIIGH